METRRKAIKRMATTVSLLGASGLFMNQVKAAVSMLPADIKGRINHSACKWCYGDIPLEELCMEGKKIGLKSIDLIGPKDWPTVNKHGMTCAMGNGAELGLTKGWNDPDLHADLIKNYEEIIPVAARNGIKNIICFSGDRNGLDDETGLKNCAKGLKMIMNVAEKHGVIVTMELLNSKIDHHDYQCDHTAWGVALCEQVGSENFKLLYDIYHMQIMEGDVIRTIEQYHPYISHYHTGGVPGRHEIDDTQELYYPAIMRAIAETGFSGFVAQEFIPTWENKLDALSSALKICSV
jgi:hydroxypyruvate isomerase